MENYKPGAARLFFDTWFAAINTESKLPRVHDKKLSLLALSKLLEVDGEMIPVSLREGWFGIVAGALVIFKSLPQAISSAFDISLSLSLYFYFLLFIYFTVMLTDLIDRKALEQKLIDEEDEEEDDDARYLNLEGDDDGESICFLFSSG